MAIGGRWDNRAYALRVYLEQCTVAPPALRRDFRRCLKDFLPPWKSFSQTGFWRPRGDPRKANSNEYRVYFELVAAFSGFIRCRMVARCPGERRSCHASNRLASASSCPQACGFLDAARSAGASSRRRSHTNQASPALSKKSSSSISPRFTSPHAMSQYVTTIRKLALASLPIGYFLLNSSRVLASKLAVNQARASRSLASRRKSYSFRSRFACSCVACPIFPPEVSLAPLAAALAPSPQAACAAGRRAECRARPAPTVSACVAPAPRHPGASEPSVPATARSCRSPPETPRPAHAGHPAASVTMPDRPGIPRPPLPAR